MKERKIILFNQSSGYLMVDIVNAYATSEKFSEVVFAYGDLRLGGVDIDKSVKIEKISSYKRTSTMTRMVSWLKATFQMLYLIKCKYKDYELFLVSNPPTITFLPLFLKNKYSVLVYDVFPDALAVTNFISNKNVLYKIWAKRNVVFYRNAAFVYTITETMAKTINQYCSIDKIKVVPIWSNQIINQIKREENKFIMHHKLEDKFVVLYSGNIGKNSGIDALIDVAYLLREYSDIIFLFIGEGYEKRLLENKVEKYGLGGVCKFLSFQPFAQLPHSLSAANIGVVVTPEQGGQISIPSKVYNLIRLAVPLLGIASDDSELNKLITDNHNLGGCFAHGEIEKMATFIRKMYTDNQAYKEIKENLLNYSNHNTSQQAYNFIV